MPETVRLFDDEGAGQPVSRLEPTRLAERLAQLWLPESAAVLAALERGPLNLDAEVAKAWRAEGLYDGKLTRKGRRLLELLRGLAELLDVEV